MLQNPDPVMRAVGLTLEEGYPSARPASPAGRGPARSFVTDVSPVFRNAWCGFTAITVPTGITIASGESGWYLLASYDPMKDFGQEVSLVEAIADLGPTDPNATATDLVWGNTHGQGAAIVIGRNLGIPASTWTSRYAPLPAVETGTEGLLSTSKRSDSILRFYRFATGARNDSVPNRRWMKDPFAPDVDRFPEQNKIDVALVVRGSYVNALGAGRTLNGNCDIQLRVRLAKTLQSFR